MFTDRLRLILTHQNLTIYSSVLEIIIMELGDEIMLEVNNVILHIIDFGFPRRTFRRPDYFEQMDDMVFYRRFGLTKLRTLYVLEIIKDALEFENDS